MLYVGFYRVFKPMYQSGKIAAVVGLALFLMASPGLAQVKTANYWFNRAFQEQNTDRKIEYYQKSIQLNPQDPESHNNLGILYKKKGMYAEAIKEYEAALAISGYETPEYAHYNLGILYRDRAIYQEAIDHFKKVVQINPRYVKAYNAMGLAYKALGQYEEAIQSFKQAIELDPNDVQASYNLQSVWHLSEEDSAAIRQAEVLYDEGVKLLKQDKLKVASAKFKEVLQLNAKHAGAKEKLNVVQNKLKFKKWCKLGEDFSAKKEWEKALSYFERASEYPLNEQERRYVSTRQREIQAQIKLLAQQVKIDGLYREGLTRLGNQDWLQAISKFTKILMLMPEHKLAQEKNDLAKAGYYYNNGLGLLKGLQWEDAEEKFNNVLRIDPQHAGAQEQLGIIAEHKRQEEIKLLLQKAVQAQKSADVKTAARNYQLILSIDADQAQALAGLKDIGQQTAVQQKTEWKWLNYINKPIWWISAIVIAIVSYLAFIKIIRPSKIVNHYLRYKEYDKARIIYEKILEKDDGRRSIYPALTSIYIKLKRLDMAEQLISLCEKKIKQVESSLIPLWYLTLGEIYQQQERLDDAQKEMELAYKMQPESEEIKQKLTALYRLKLELRPEDVHIVVKLNTLNKAKTTKWKSVSLPQPKVENKSKSDTTLDILKECFGHSKG